MSSPKDKIKEHLSIEDCISSYITIFPSGKNFKAKCPFHNEKTPSFFISPERNSYYCFGCGEKGDIFSFVEKFEGVDFRGALKILGAKTGIEINSWEKEKKEGKEILYEIMEKATEYFENEFKKENKAKEYLLNRGLNEKTIKYFRVGYAPNTWLSVSSFLIQSGFKEEDLLKVGLIKKTEKDNGKSFYDRFRGRIMFPIMDPSGRVIAFSGRILEENKNANIVEAKYINSTDSILFNKSSTLFGIDKAKMHIRSKGYTIVVEGQLDLLMSHQIGLENTVAISGTALASNTVNNNEDTVNNLGLVKRLSSNIIFALDGDEAGLRATRRSALIALSLDMQAKIANLIDGRDPADIIKDNPDSWKDIIRNAKPIISFEIDKIIKDSSDVKTWGKNIREIIFPYINMTKSNMEQVAYLKEIHYKTGILDNAINTDFENYQKANLIQEKEKEAVVQNKKTSRLYLLEKQFFSIIFFLENSIETKDKAEKYVKEFREKIGVNEFQKNLDTYDIIREKLVMETERWYDENIDSLEKDLNEVLISLEEEILIKSAREKIIQIRKFEIEGDKEKSNKFLKEYQDLLNKIQNIKNSRV